MTKSWRSRFTLPPGSRFELAAIDPGDTGKLEKKDAKDELEDNLDRLRELQERLYAGGERALLVVLQAMDAGGKDGTIKHVCGAFNPQGVEVTSFKVPSAAELAHDYLWRIHRRTPARGMVGIFNRSHYEDVVAVRVRDLVPEERWRARYRQIRDFESHLAACGTTIVKLFLHLSPAEQAERLAERRDRPDKQWKFNPGDLEDRERWRPFMAAYEDALTECNTELAPWYVVPADHKWYRNLVVSRILIETLESMDLAYPDPVPDIAAYDIPEVE